MKDMSLKHENNDTLSSHVDDNDRLQKQLDYIDWLGRNCVNSQEIATKWTEYINKDDKWKQLIKEVKYHDKLVKRITDRIEADYDAYEDIIREALKFYLTETFSTESLERIANESGDKSWIDKEKLQQALDADKDRAMDELVKWQQEFEKSSQLIGNKPTSYAKLKEDFE